MKETHPARQKIKAATTAVICVGETCSLRVTEPKRSRRRWRLVMHDRATGTAGSLSHRERVGVRGYGVERL